MRSRAYKSSSPLAASLAGAGFAALAYFGLIIPGVQAFMVDLTASLTSM